MTITFKFIFAILVSNASLFSGASFSKPIIDDSSSNDLRFVTSQKGYGALSCSASRAEGQHESVTATFVIDATRSKINFRISPDTEDEWMAGSFLAYSEKSGDLYLAELTIREELRPIGALPDGEKIFLDAANGQLEKASLTMTIFRGNGHSLLYTLLKLYGDDFDTKDILINFDCVPTPL